MKTSQFTCNKCYSIFEVGVSDRQAVRFICCPVCGKSDASEGQGSEAILSFKDWADSMNKEFPEYDPIHPTEEDYEQWMSQYERDCIDQGRAYEILDEW